MSELVPQFEASTTDTCAPGDITKADHTDQQSNIGSQNSSTREPIQCCATSTIRTYSLGSNEDAEPFETFQLKIIQLFHDIGSGEPSKLDPIEIGSYNHIICLTFPSRQPQDYILRIPRDGKNWDKSAEIKDQVAVVDHISEYFKVPAVVAYDSTTNNAISSAYVLYERVQGVCLATIYDALPIHEKINVAEQVAHFIIQMGSLRLGSPGLLGRTEKLPNVSYKRFAPFDGFEIHGFQSARFGTSHELPRFQVGCSLFGMLQTLFNIRIENYEDTEPWMVPKMEKLHKIACQMQDAGFIWTSDIECGIWHWDFAARNIMVDYFPPKQPASISTAVDKNASSKPTEMTKNLVLPISKEFKEKFISESPSLEHLEITGVLDWDGALSVHTPLTRVPPSWLWSSDKERGLDWSGNPDVPQPLAPEGRLIKARFDQIMAKYDSRYMTDAYGRGPWLRRLARFALFGFSKIGCNERYEKFVEEWRGYYEKIGGEQESSDSLDIDLMDEGFWDEVTSSENGEDREMISDRGEGKADESEAGEKGKKATKDEHLLIVYGVGMLLIGVLVGVLVQWLPQ